MRNSRNYLSLGWAALGPGAGQVGSSSYGRENQSGWVMIRLRAAGHYIVDAVVGHQEELIREKKDCAMDWYGCPWHCEATQLNEQRLTKWIEAGNRNYVLWNFSDYPEVKHAATMRLVVLRQPPINQRPVQSQILYRTKSNSMVPL